MNLCKKKPAIEISDANCSDVELARRYWLAYTSREKSIITALFCGQFQSCTQCAGCTHISSKYDPFTVLQLPLPRTEMKSARWLRVMLRALSIVLSFSDGRLPIQCSIRVPADSSLSTIKEALNALDSSIDLSRNRIQLGHVEDCNVVEVFDASFRLNGCSYSDFTVFVLPPEGHFLGARAFNQYKLHTPEMIQTGQSVKLNVKGKNGLPVTGVVKEVYTDFCFAVECSDGQKRQVLVTDLIDGDKYMLQQGDFVFVEMCACLAVVTHSSKQPTKFEYGVFLGVSPHHSQRYSVRLYPSEKEVQVPLEVLCRRRTKPRNMYLVQRYLGVVRCVCVA